MVMPAFGQTVFGQKIRIWPGHFRDRIWQNRIWPELVFQSVDRIWPELVLLVFWPRVCVLCLQDFWWVSSRFFGRCLVGVFKMFGGCLHWWVSSKFCVGLFKILVPLCWTSSLPRTAPSGGRPLRRTAQNFALFFLCPAGNFILSSLSGESSR